MSRHRKALPFASSTDQIQGELPESDFAPQCQKWALRVLVELGGHRAILMPEHCAEPALITALGVAPHPEKNYCRDEMLAALQVRHSEMSKQKCTLPPNSPLIQNVRWLGEQVGLNQSAQDVLIFCVLARQNVHLNQALDVLGDLTNSRIQSVLSVILDLTCEDVSKVFASDSSLVRARLARIDSSHSYSFSNKIDLIRGLAERLMVSHANPFDLFADSFVVAPTSTLAIERFDHLKLKVQHLQSYLAQVLAHAKKGANVLIYGPPGTGKTEFARTLSSALHAELFQVAIENSAGNRISGSDRLSSYRLSQRILAARGKALILFDEIEDINMSDEDDEDNSSSRPGNLSGKKGWINQLLEQNQVPSIWISNNIRFLDAAHLRRFDYHLHLDIPPVGIRTALLAEHVRTLGVSTEWCENMAANDSLAPAMMARAAKVASDMHAGGATTPIENLLAEVIEGALTAQSRTLCRKPAKAKLMPYRIDSVNADCDLSQIIDGLKASGEGLICLYGPSGTGKSAFAANVAEQLGLSPMLQRASDILSPYRGETEARMADMFRRAQEEKAVLILDEADSFLRSRESVRKSWEVTAVNEMLTQMEAYQGVFFATTNLMDQLDTASMRRFDVKICFGYLKPKKCTALLTDACKVIGIECDDAIAKLLLNMDKLTPGDFANVVRQSRLHPVRSAHDFIGRLAQEVKHKQLAAGRPIGFLVEAA